MYYGFKVYWLLKFSPRIPILTFKINFKLFLWFISLKDEQVLLKHDSKQGRWTLITLSEMGQMEILPQTVESNLSLSTFTREGHQTPWLYCPGVNIELMHTYNSFCSLLVTMLFSQAKRRGSTITHNRFFSQYLLCIFNFAHFNPWGRWYSPHLEIWNGEPAAGGKAGFGNGALEFLYTG